VVKYYGLKWISLMLLVPLPWSSRVFLTVLAPSKRPNEQAGRRHKTLIFPQTLLPCRRGPKPKKGHRLTALPKRLGEVLAYGQDVKEKREKRGQVFLHTLR